MERRSALVEQQILRLEVAVHNVLRVQVLKDEHDLSGVESRRLIIEVPGAPQMREEFAANHILHHKIDVSLVLKGAVQVHDERVIDHVQQNVALCMARVVNTGG